MYAELRVILIKRRITMKAFAEMIGMEQASLSRKMNGTYRFTEDDIYRICSVLNVDPREIFFNRQLLNKQENYDRMPV